MDYRKYFVFDAERTKYPFTGLYEFCVSLGSALNAKAPLHDLVPTYYIPRGQDRIFGGSNRYLSQSGFHKFFFPSTKKYSFWHATHQQTDYFPFNEKIPVVLTVHDLNFLYDEEKTDHKKQQYLNILQKKIDRADQIVAVSSFTADELTKKVELKGKIPTVIYNGIHPLAVESHKPRYLPKQKFIFNIGTVLSKKNIHVLPALLINNDFELLIAGVTNDLSYKKKIVQYAIKLGVSDRLHFLGTISNHDKFWYYQKAICLAFPSLAEGFGLPVAEAMYCGTPLLLSRHGSIPEIAKDTGIYLDNFEPEHLQERLEELLSDDNSTERKNKQQKIAQQFSWDLAAEQYIEVYKRVI